MTSSLEEHFGALRSLLERPAPLIPPLARPLLRASRQPWTLHPTLTGWDAIFSLAAQGRRAHRQRWDEQVAPYLLQRLSAWPDAARSLPDSLHRSVIHTRPGFDSPLLQLIRSLNMRSHSLRHLDAALSGERLSHITQLVVPDLQRRYTFDDRPHPLSKLGRWRLPALRELALIDDQLPIEALAEGLREAALPQLRTLRLIGQPPRSPSPAARAAWDALLELPAIGAIESLHAASLARRDTLSEQAAERLISLIERMPALVHLSLSWAMLTSAQLKRLCAAPRFAQLDALDLVTRARGVSDALLKAPRLPSPRALALKDVDLSALVATPLLDRVEALELWVMRTSQELPLIAAHPRWPHLQHLSLNLMEPASRTLLQLDPPPALRTLCVSWYGARALDAETIGALARWSGLEPATRSKRLRLAMFSHTTPMLASS